MREKSFEILDRIRDRIRDYIRDQIHEPQLPNVPFNQVALTLDARAARFDQDRIDFLIRDRIPATFFPTKRWLDRNA